jgi:His-Xaa-Ser system protein HxsD
VADSENIGNLEIDRNEGVVRISVNPKIYAMSVIYGAAHAFTKDTYVLLDGDEEIEVTVELKPMEKSQDLEELGRKFCNRLLSYQIYKQKIKENETVRNLIIYRALATNSAISVENEETGSDKETACKEKNDCKK